MNERERDEFLDRSNERDSWESRIQAAERLAFTRGQAEAESRGYARAVADIKRAEHQIVSEVRLESQRHAPGGEIWRDAVRRNGGTEYGGEGKPRVPVPPEWWMTLRELRAHKEQEERQQQRPEPEREAG